MNEAIESIFEDVNYFKSLYPKSVYPLYRIISEYSDQLEYEGSLMYDEYPDRERLRLVTEQILRDINQQVTEFPTRDEFIAILVLNEFLHRRIRRQEFTSGISNEMDMQNK